MYLQGSSVPTDWYPTISTSFYTNITKKGKGSWILIKEMKFEHHKKPGRKICLINISEMVADFNILQ